MHGVGFRNRTTIVVCAPPPPYLAAFRSSLLAENELYRFPLRAKTRDTLILTEKQIISSRTFQ